MAEPADIRQAVAGIAAGAAFLRKREPLSPAPYLILRGLRWGELRTASRLGDSTLLEAPPTELRQRVKRLALAKKWSDCWTPAKTPWRCLAAAPGSTCSGFRSPPALPSALSINQSPPPYSRSFEPC